MTKLSAIAGGLSAGAVMMYLLDPIAGRRRRAVLRDKACSTARKFDDALRIAGEDLGNRASGMAASIKSAFRSAPASDEKLVQRVRSKLGRYTSHPRQIEINAHDRVVTVSGHVLASELDPVLLGIARGSGVKRVESKLVVHESADAFPKLKGGVPRTGEHFDLFQSRWAPATRMMVFISAMLLSAYGLRRGGLSGATWVTIATALMAEAASNDDLNHLLGMPEETEKAAPATAPATEAAHVQPMPV
jgi:hypothetical protein